MDVATVPQPMRIGEILDRSLQLLRKMLPEALYPLLIIAGGNTLVQYGFNHANSMDTVAVSFLALLAIAVVTWLFYMSCIFLASDFWQNRKTGIREAYSRVTIGLAVRSILLSLRIGAVTFLLLLLLIIPGIVYAVNRLLAYYIFFLEDTTIHESLQRSKFLMTQGKWYSLSSPLMRVSGLLLITMLISFAVGAVGEMSALHFGSTAGSAASLVVHFVSQFLQGSLYLFNMLVMVGFYYDLRARYEGYGLIAQPK